MLAGKHVSQSRHAYVDIFGCKGIFILDLKTPDILDTLKCPLPPPILRTSLKIVCEGALLPQAYCIPSITIKLCSSLNKKLTQPLGSTVN